MISDPHHHQGHLLCQQFSAFKVTAEISCSGNVQLARLPNGMGEQLNKLRRFHYLVCILFKSLLTVVPPANVCHYLTSIPRGIQQGKTVWPKFEKKWKMENGPTRISNVRYSNISNIQIFPMIISRLELNLQ